MPPSLAAPPPGLFVTLEGGEGAGKSTQIERLGRRLREAGHRVVVTREPGGTPRAEAIRAVLLRGDARAYGPLAEAVLFAAARADHVRGLIRPALSEGAVVLCDRFVDSSRVYQGSLGRVPDRLIEVLARAAVEELRPDLTLILDVPAEIGLARARARRSGGGADRFEGEGTAYHARVREAFRAIAAREPERCMLIEAGGPPEAVEARAWAALSSRLGRARARHVA